MNTSTLADEKVRAIDLLVETNATIYTGGRGSGKSFRAKMDVIRAAEGHRNDILLAGWNRDVVRLMAERVVVSSNRPTWHPSTLEIAWSNGSRAVATTFGQPYQIRGLRFDLAYLEVAGNGNVEELAQFLDALRGSLKAGLNGRLIIVFNASE